MIISLPFKIMLSCWWTAGRCDGTLAGASTSERAMNAQVVLDVGRDALWLCLLLAGGPLLPCWWWVCCGHAAGRHADQRK